MLRVASALISIAITLLIASSAHATCDGKTALQVLGSGGPIADDNRASSGYILWHKGEAKLLIDAGGGTALRFGQANAQFETLNAIIITHFHTDHSAELPALLKSSYFSNRERPLPIFGPSGATKWPSTTEFITGLFHSETGIYRYLDGFLDGSDGMYQLLPENIDISKKQPTLLLNKDNIKLYAVGVHHGPVPALGVLIEVDGKRLAISGDESDNNPAFAKMIKDADLLLMANAIPEHAGRIAKHLHATPSYIGKLAKEQNIKHVVLTHLMARSINKLDQSKALIRSQYQGKLSVAEDLQCYPL